MKQITKQSDLDYQVVTLEGVHAAWVTKLRLGYEVVTDTGANYFFPTFVEAKKFALGWANYVESDQK